MADSELTNKVNSMRPRDLAVLLLAAGGLPPRQRARDQQADRAGAQLRRHILERLVTLDPEPEALESVLLSIVQEMGNPTGPARALAADLRDDWLAAQSNPQFLEHLVGEAVSSHHAPRDERQSGSRAPRDKRSSRGA